MICFLQMPDPLPEVIKSDSPFSSPRVYKTLIQILSISGACILAIGFIVHMGKKLYFKKLQRKVIAEVIEMEKQKGALKFLIISWVAGHRNYVLMFVIVWRKIHFLRRRYRSYSVMFQSFQCLCCFGENSCFCGGASVSYAKFHPLQKNKGAMKHNCSV